MVRRHGVLTLRQQNGQRFAADLHHVIIIDKLSGIDRSMGMTARKTIRVLGVSLALLALLVFTMVVGTGWHHHDSVNDSHCPYCHLSHQTAAQPENTRSVAILSTVASLPLPEDFEWSAAPVVSHTPPRAPPAA